MSREIPPHKPYVPDQHELAEFTLVVLLFGTLQAAFFGIADAYLALKLGMTVGASIPAAVISMSVLRGLLRRNSVLENNLVQNMASVGESLSCGAAFTIPAFFLLEQALTSQGQPLPFALNGASVYFVIAMGGLMGILFMIPMRRYLIVKEHGRLRYPEGTACAEVLIAGDKGGNAALGVLAGVISASFYRILMNALGLFKEIVSWPVKTLHTAVSFDLLPSLLAVGYIIGLETCCVMLAGALLGWFVIIPLIAYFGAGWSVPLAPAKVLIAQMSPDDIKNEYLRYIGAGAVAFGGFVSLVKALPTIFESIAAALREITNRGGEDKPARTNQDIPLPMVLAGWGVLFLLIALNTSVNLAGFLGAALTVIFSFFFVTVSSRIVGLVGTTSMPLSGMTIGALLTTCLVLKSAGYIGSTGVAAALVVAAMVCISISIGGDISQDLKIGFLVGATPRWVQITQILSVVTSTAAVCFTLKMLMPKVLNHEFPAPQANLLYLLTQGVISGDLPWVPVIIGMGLALSVELMGIASLPFAIGLYLPLDLSTTLLVGGIVHYLFHHSTAEHLRKALYEHGLLLCSGMVAGDALVGVALAMLSAQGADTVLSEKFSHYAFTQSNAVAVLAFLVLTAFLVGALQRQRKQLQLDPPQQAEDSPEP